MPAETGLANPCLFSHWTADCSVSSVRRNFFTSAWFVAAALMARAEPLFPEYARTMTALEKYKELARADSFEALPSVAKVVEPGDAYRGVPRLARLLRLVGDLPEDAVLADNSMLYAEPLVDAVRRFQARHGLEADGRIGKATITQLNTPLEARVAQLELALERWRSLALETGRPYVLINIPEFRMTAFEPDRRQRLEFKIVVGARKTPTPLLKGDLTHVIFRPYWNVPRSIVRTELLAEFERDSTYLAKNRYQVVDARGEMVTDRAVTPEILEGLRSGKLQPRQTPGPHNSLGLVKFVFKNEDDIYLHDTPAKRLFDKARRDFSHGCIRVENAEEFAVWLLRANEGWNRERVHRAMQEKDDFRVDLAQPVPLAIAYITAAVTESGEVRFFGDVYGRDKPTSASRGQRPRE